jgi:hypothetical protein
VRLVEPGYGPDTRFTQNGATRMNGLITEPYAAFAQRIFATFGQLAAVTSASDVAEGVWHAATDAGGRLHFAAGPDSVALAERRIAGFVQP